MTLEYAVKKDMDRSKEEGEDYDTMLSNLVHGSGLSEHDSLKLRRVVDGLAQQLADSKTDRTMDKLFDALSSRISNGSNHYELRDLRILMDARVLLARHGMSNEDYLMKTLGEHD